MTRWSRLRQSFWFIPALLCLAAVVLAEGLIFIDDQLGDSNFGALNVLITKVGESGSRDLLGAIAGSMLTVASTTFSITIAVLALSSSTYGPRLVRNFMADRGNQFVLGIFVATFLYSLLVLRKIRVVDDSGDFFVPHLAVNVAVLLAVASIGVLVYFIHHISDSVQVWTLAEQVRTDLIGTVDRLYPEDSGMDAAEVNGDPPDLSLPAQVDEGTPLRSRQTGYVQGIDVDGLLAIASEHDLVVTLSVRPGQHVIEDGVLAMLTPPGRDIDEDRCSSLRTAFRIGRARTPQEDVEFSVLLLEEMAVRALSPSTNDPYTAINALDDLASGLVLLAARPLPSPYRYDSDGHLRVVAPGVSPISLLDHVLNAMRIYAIEHPTVLHRTLELIEQVGVAGDDPAVLLSLDGQARDLVEAFAATTPQSGDLDALTRHAGRVRERLLTT
ncbi:DUF2254 domain-containing protein [Nocardioides sp.]|uniref:DUF2254 domain-containing protein n=1 Tax=Nocardioides sp. TaxID=35761 RepID=UPI002733A083|nr:DUF2254 domain-containing protein [Nocardioides sp.]MDP3893073.1 DUF2254 domain-containing protein [Nocardioides sp.]